MVQLSSAMDLERSFGPIYARGLLRQGQGAFAVLGVNQQETQASIDAALTFAILCMNACREAQDGKVIVEGLKLFVPAGTSALTRERMAHLNQEAAKWQLYELAERGESLREIDCGDRGNIATRLVHGTDETAARERFAESIAHMRNLVPECEIVVLSSAEVVFRFRGLEFCSCAPVAGCGVIPQCAGDRLWCGRRRTSAGRKKCRRIRRHVAPRR